MSKRIRTFFTASLLLAALCVSVFANAQTFNGSANSTAGTSLIPSSGTGGCTVGPQIVGGTVFNATVAGLSAGAGLQNARLNLTHTFDSDLLIQLRAPNGQLLQLTANVGGAGDNFTNTVFQDGAPSIATGTAPFTGTFAPGGLIPPPCGTAAAPTITTIGAFAAGQNGVWQLVIYDDAGGDSGNMISWSLTFPGADADLQIVLSDSPDPVVAGTNLSYTATLTNTGPAAAMDASLAFPIPVGTSFVSATPSAGGTCTLVTPITCTWVGATANAAVRSAVIVVAVPANAANGSLISASVVASSASPDSDPADNTSTTGTAVTTAADLSMTLSDSPDPVVAGANLTWVASLSNAGASDAQGASITLPLPAETTFVSVTPSVGGICNAASPVVCTWAGATAPGVTRMATVVALVNPATLAGTKISATAVSASTTTDPTAANNSASATTTVSTSADLAITLTDAPDPVIAGNNLTYTLTLTNAGLSAAQDAAFSLPLPAGTSLVSVTPSAGGICNAASPVVCTWSGLTGTTDVRAATVVVAVAASQTGNLSATATASSMTPDPAAANNSATASTLVQAQSDLSITLTDAPDPVSAGTNLTYTAVVSNAGPSNAAAVVVNLPTPAGTSFVSGSVSGGGSCAAGISCSVTGTIAPGATRTVTITVLVAASAINGSVIGATATVSTSATDLNAVNNSASTTTTVATRADLQLTLTSSAATVLVNVPVTFVATSQNLGPADAQNLSITLTLSPDFRYASHVATGATCTVPQIGNSGAIVCTWAGATAAGGTRTLAVTAYSNVEGSSGVNASTTSATTDPVAGNNAAAVTVVVGYGVNGIPTLGQYALLLLSVLMGTIGVLTMRQRH